MLQVTIPAQELFNEQTGCFIKLKKDLTLQLEHSLISLSKWEEKWHKPFLSDKEVKTQSEMFDYIRCMVINHDFDENAIYAISPADVQRIHDYISDSHTATTITDRRPQRGKKETLTSEVIYAHMISLGIPFSCEKWHLNRLLMLIKVCAVRNGPQQMMSQKEIYAQNQMLNAMRRRR